MTAVCGYVVTGISPVSTTVCTAGGLSADICLYQLLVKITECDLSGRDTRSEECAACSCSGCSTLYRFWETTWGYLKLFTWELRGGVMS